MIGSTLKVVCLHSTSAHLPEMLKPSEVIRRKLSSWQRCDSNQGFFYLQAFFSLCTTPAHRSTFSWTQILLLQFIIFTGFCSEYYELIFRQCFEMYALSVRVLFRTHVQLAYSSPCQKSDYLKAGGNEVWELAAGRAKWSKLAPALAWMETSLTHTVGCWAATQPLQQIVVHAWVLELILEILRVKLKFRRNGMQIWDSLWDRNDWNGKRNISFFLFIERPKFWGQNIYYFIGLWILLFPTVCCVFTYI